MVASLGDRYSEFLQPTAYRRAIRRPQPAEREYLAAQFTGTGIQVGPAPASAAASSSTFVLLHHVVREMLAVNSTGRCSPAVHGACQLTGK